MPQPCSLRCYGCRQKTPMRVASRARIDHTAETGGAATLNPERDSVVVMASQKKEIQPLAA